MWNISNRAQATTAEIGMMWFRSQYDVLEFAWYVQGIVGMIILSESRLHIGTHTVILAPRRKKEPSIEELESVVSWWLSSGRDGYSESLSQAEEVAISTIGKDVDARHYNFGTASDDVR